MTDDGAELPRWRGITEPTTVFTDVVLAALAFVLAVRLGHRSAVDDSAAGAWLAAGLLATGFAAVIGAVAHATDPARDAGSRERLWRSTLYISGLIGAATVASVAYFAARGSMRTVLLTFAVIKLVVFVRQVSRTPVFRVAAIDYGIALAILVIGAVSEMLRRGAPGMVWLIAGVFVSLVAGIVQAKRLAFHRQFNHNDLYHVIQMVALYSFYRGGLLLVDR
jgi:hypothetical protein